MNTVIECIPCLIQQAINTAELLEMDMENSEKMTRQVLEFISRRKWDEPTPDLAKHIYRIISKYSGNPDPYKTIKTHFNQDLMDYIDDLRIIVKSSDDPFLTALKLAISGNIIDFGTRHEFSRESIMEQIDKIEHTKLTLDDSQDLKQTLKKSRQLLYLGDNCGEIVFDRVFIEFLKAEYPRLKIIFAVRGAPVLNDITQKDAIETGMSEIVDVIDNGNDAPGTILKDCSTEFAKQFDSSDIIIAKGQGNFESLSHNKRDNIYFLFMAKCIPVSSFLGISRMSLVCRNITHIRK